MSHNKMPKPSRTPSYQNSPVKSSYDIDVNERDASTFVPSMDRLSASAAARDRYYKSRNNDQENPYYSGVKKGAPKKSPSPPRAGCFAGRRKWWWLLALLVLLGAAGAVAGVMISRKSSSSRDYRNDHGVAGVVNSDPKDPSIFTKDPALHQSFYGMAYTPQDAQYPTCRDSLGAVIEDIQLISQLTNRVRLYGSDCEISYLVLEAVEKTKVDMMVWLAIFVPQVADDPNDVVYNRQVDAMRKAIQKFGIDHVGGITVGNEFLMNGGDESVIINKMAAMRGILSGMNLPRVLPVGTAETGSLVTTTLTQASDFLMANIHPWFGGMIVDEAADWVHSYAVTQQPASALLATNKPELYVAETGWPTNANTSAFARNEYAVAGVPQLNTFLNTFVCEANQNITAGGEFSKYFYFEAFDEPWKEIFGSVEPYWGLFTANKTLKEGLVLPDCSHP